MVDFYDIASFDHICAFMEPKSVSLCAPERILKRDAWFPFEAKGLIQGGGKH